MGVRVKKKSPYMVVPQAIKLNRAAAQNWSHTFYIRFIAFLGQSKPPYKFSSKSVKKQKSCGIVTSALLAYSICPKVEMSEIQGF